MTDRLPHVIYEDEVLVEMRELLRETMIELFDARDGGSGDVADLEVTVRYLKMEIASIEQEDFCLRTLSSEDRVADLT